MLRQAWEQEELLQPRALTQAKARASQQPRLGSVKPWGWFWGLEPAPRATGRSKTAVMGSSSSGWASKGLAWPRGHAAAGRAALLSLQ